MAIVFPRPLPDLRYARSQMTLQRGLSVNQLAGGATQAAETGAALWRLSIQTVRVRWSVRRGLIAWHNSLAGTRRILGFDWLGSYPVAYGVNALGLVKSGGGAWGGTAVLGVVTATTLRLSGLPAGYKASAGDRLSFPWAGGRAYHEIVEAATATAAGVVTVSVEPAVRLNPAPAAGAIVDLIRPTCLMMIVPDSWQCDESAALASASFEAVQVLP